MNLVFLGPPGSGKGTQAGCLANMRSYTHLSTGDVLREAIKNGTDLGKTAEGFMSKGNLVPDDIMVNMIEEKILSGAIKKGFILDGFPRTIPQAKSLKRMFKSDSIVLNKAILFDVPDEEIIRRLSGRWSCPKCQADYNYPAKLPKTKGVCDKDDEPLSRRHDDEKSVVTNRLAVYKKQTQPIVEFYRNEQVLTTITATGTPEAVFGELLQSLGQGNA